LQLLHLESSHCKSLQVTKVSLNLTKSRRLWTCLNFDFQRLTSFEAKATA
jgi:hypothetical protein